MKKSSVYSCQFTVFSILILCLFSSANGEMAQNPKYTFYKANTLYEEGKFDEAIVEYQKLLKDNVESGNLYYNLGNCYFKKGEPGRAILNYERAKRLIPQDSDLKSNYEYAGSLLKERPQEITKSWIEKLLDKSSRIVTIDWLTVFLSIL